MLITIIVTFLVFILASWLILEIYKNNNGRIEGGKEMKSTKEETNNGDYWCRNCKFRFVPTRWSGAWLGCVTVKCPNCGSNATEKYINQHHNKKSEKYKSK